MFVSMILKEIPRESESVHTMVNYGQEKILDEIKRDFINFESEKRNERHQNLTR